MIAYVDGFNLYYGIRTKGWQRYYWLNIRMMATGLLRPDQELVRTKYFTTLVSATPEDPEKSRRQVAYLEALGTLGEFDIFYGHYLQKQMKCFKCGANWATHEEKMTDVNIAVEMLNDAYEDAFDTALLVSGDSDLTGPVTTIRRKFPRKWVVVAFPPERHSDQLRKAAHRTLTIGRKKLADSQFPDEVYKAGGFVLRRPESWKRKSGEGK